MFVDELKHYQDYAGLEDEELLDEAIALCEDYFKLLSKDELLHHSRVLAMCYLALKYQKSKVD